MTQYHKRLIRTEVHKYILSQSYDKVDSSLKLHIQKQLRVSVLFVRNIVQDDLHEKYS